MEIELAVEISTSVTLKSVILFLFDFKKRSCFGKKDFHFCLVYGKVYQGCILNSKFIFLPPPGGGGSNRRIYTPEVYLKISIYILFYVRGNGSFPGLNFHITYVESEPAVLKEIPPCF